MLARRNPGRTESWPLLFFGLAAILAESGTGKVATPETLTPSFKRSLQKPVGDTTEPMSIFIYSLRIQPS